MSQTIEIRRPRGHRRLRRWNASESRCRSESRVLHKRTIFYGFFPAYNLLQVQTFSKTMLCRLQPIKSKFPKKVFGTRDRDHSRPHQARGTTLPSGHLKARASCLVVVLRRPPSPVTLETHVSSLAQLGFRDRTNESRLTQSTQ